MGIPSPAAAQTSRKGNRRRRARIVATLGPASCSAEMIERLVRAGVNVARLNLSHGTHEEHAASIRYVREVSEKLDTPVAILLDLQGPKIRVGALAAPVELKAGETIQLYGGPLAPGGTAEASIPVEFPELFGMVHPGDGLLLDDGRLALTVTSVDADQLAAQVKVGGVLMSHKGINLPGIPLSIPGFTEKDRADLEFGLAQAVDAVAISFVRTSEDILEVRAAIDRLLPESGRFPLVIAKLERPEALDNLDAILDLVDGVMVARGDLGVEVPPERVPVLQKRIITAANRRAKIVITATQMLESMVSNLLPTRAEASDVANAIFDGTDAVMLSAETASGDYPVQAVEIMDRIACEAEEHYLEWGQQRPEALPDASDDATTMAYAARELAHDVDVEGIAVFTVSGKSALLVSEVRPRTPILAITPDPETYRRLAFLWGVRPFLVPFADSLDQMLASLEKVVAEEGLLQPGQQVVVVCSYPVGALRPPNMALLHTLTGSGQTPAI